MSIRNELLEEILSATGGGGSSKTNGFIDYNHTMFFVFGLLQFKSISCLKTF